MSKQQSLDNPRSAGFIILLTIILIGLNLRPSLASIGPLLGSIQTDIQLSFSAASLLTMLPVLTMGLAIFSGFSLAKRLGEARLLTYSIILLSAATAARYWVDSTLMLTITAFLAGVGIALIQALMPALIKANFPTRVPVLMGFYITAIMGGAAIAAAGSPYVENFSTNWRLGLACWSVLGIVALALWIINHKHFHFHNAKGKQPAPINYWTKHRAWTLALFFGLGTAAYTCVLAWLSPYAIEFGYTQKNAGWLLSFLTTLEVVSGLICPLIAARSKDRRPVIVTLCFMMMIGFAGLAYAPEKGLWLWSGFLGLAIGGIFPMSLIVTMDHHSNPVSAGKLAAFVQGIGYIIAAFSPWIAGIIRDVMTSFANAWLLLAICSVISLVLALLFHPHRHLEPEESEAPLAPSVA
ncbi:cyanate transporter [Zooshikella sp. RANM57]|uniref:cyanate transporter n=1 Tax=Zooshikella sp. RANM57 TaxID=3425863 RepID=UPI003D6DC9B0